MKPQYEAIHHVGLVVEDSDRAERFYVDILGLDRVPGRPSWFRLNGSNAIHLIPHGTGEAELPHHRYRHVALQVSDLRPVLRLLLDHDLHPFQAGFDGTQREIVDGDDPLTFGVGSIFVRDPDGNLIEFLQLGHGLFPMPGADLG